MAKKPSQRKKKARTPASSATPEVRPSIVREAAAAKAFAKEQHASATRRAYRADWVEFESWCRTRKVKPLPAKPESVAAFLSFEAQRGLKATSVSRRVAAIRYVHLSAGHEPPTNAEMVGATLRGIRRKLGTSPNQKAPATHDRLLGMLKHAPKDTTKGLRDRALLLLGFASALRRSELVAGDLQFVPEGLRVHVRGGKTDQEKRGSVVPVLRGKKACPVDAVRAWLDAAGIRSGAVFRRVFKNGKVGRTRLSDRAVARIVKHYALLAGFDPDLFAGHSLRAGFTTSAVMAGASAFRVMDVTRHKKTDTLRGYVRRAEEFKDHAGKDLL